MAASPATPQPRTKVWAGLGAVVGFGFFVLRAGFRLDFREA